MTRTTGKPGCLLMNDEITLRRRKPLIEGYLWPAATKRPLLKRPHRRQLQRDHS
ncbi:MAG: hypothetical protein R6V49_06825 [Bacteroidales bacterium]